MGKYREKYTYDRLAPVVAKSFSVAQVLRELGIKWTGGTHAHVRRRMLNLGIDTSHFKGQANNFGVDHQGGSAKLLWQDILVSNRNGYREKASNLRRALLEAGVSYLCVFCKNPGKWRGKKLTLEVDHINQDPYDNRRENLRFVCPNCHAIHHLGKSV